MKRSLVNSRILEGQGHSNKVLPSSNPIRNPSPDLLSRKERINYTQSPSTIEMKKTQKFDPEEIMILRKKLADKDKSISNLKSDIDRLKLKKNKDDVDKAHELKETLKDKLMENGELQDKIDALENDARRNRMENSKKGGISNPDDKLNDLVNELNYNKNRNAVLEEKFMILAAEHERLLEKHKDVLDDLNRSDDDKRGHVEREKKSALNQIEDMKKKMIPILEDLEQTKLQNEQLEDELNNKNHEIKELKRENKDLKKNFDNFKKEAGQKIHDDELKINKLIDEIDRLNNLLDDLEKKNRKLESSNEEIEELKKSVKRERKESLKKAENFGNEVHNAKRQNEDLLRLVDNLKNRVEKDENYISEMEEKCAMLASEIERLKYRLDNQKRQSKIEIEDLKNSDMNRSSGLKEENENLKKKIQELINLIENLKEKQADEIEKLQKQFENILKNAIDSQIAEIAEKFEAERNRLLNRIKELENILRDLQNNHDKEIDDMNKNYQITLKETIEHQLNNLLVQFNKEKQALENKIDELQDKLKDYEDEIKRLGNEKDNNIGNLKNKLNKIEDQRLKEIDELQKELDGIKDLHFNTSGQVEFDAERAAYETTIMQLQQKIKDLLQNLKKCLDDLEEMKHIDDELNKENEDLRKKLRGYENSQNGEDSKLRKENENLKKQIIDLKEAIFAIENERKKMEMHMLQLTMTIENQNKEIERLHQIIEERKADRDNLADQLESQRNRVMNNSQKVDPKNEIVPKEKLHKIAKELDDLAESRDSYKKKYEENNMKLIDTNKNMINKIQELEGLKLKYREALNKTKNMENKLLERLKNEEIHL